MSEPGGGVGARPLRLLFASTHGPIDPSSGAAQTTRDVLALLAGRGHACRALAAGTLDFEGETPLDRVLAPLGVPVRHARATLAAGGSAAIRDLDLDGVRYTIVETASSRPDRAPDAAESRAFLDLAGQAMDRFRPDVVLTYGGHPANRRMMREACRRGIPVAFHLHNFAYVDPAFFAPVAALLVPSEFSRRRHRDVLGRDSEAIAPPLVAGRVVAADPSPRFLTFVNPSPEKGAAVFARIAAELARRRPDVPLLVVEGRGRPADLARAGLDLSGLTTLHRMASTADPRAIYRVSRAVLMPSLWEESFGRVAAEAMANGLPVLAGDRGALPETLGAAGLVLPLPARCTPAGRAVPTADEVAPWVAAVERLWDDPAHAAEHRARALAEARRWDADRLAERYEAFLRRLARP